MSRFLFGKLKAKEWPVRRKWEGASCDTMTEAVPAAPAAALPAVKGPAKRGRKPAGAPKFSGPSVTELLTQAVSASKERSGVSLAALKKSLAASGYDVEKNNSRIKLGLKSLVSRGTLVQTKGTGASGSFKLNKKQAETRDKAAKKKAPPPAAPKGRKPGAAAKGGKKPAGAKKTAKVPRRVASAAGAKKAVKSPKKPKAAAKAKKPAKSPAKAKAAKPKAKPKTPKAKVAKPKKAAAPKK
ncbi:hypothetical protein lerEdw1_010134 [Lerista edwardsae]|nr:hypothetical protein lerEdw1_010134 [Lerista edwardsae]